VKTIVVEVGDWRSEPIPCEWEQDIRPTGPGHGEIVFTIFPLETTVVTIPVEGMPNLLLFEDGVQIAWQWVRLHVTPGNTITLCGRDAV
jgi:hypothetical protein